MASADLGSKHLRFERRGRAGWCIVDRPAARNALTPSMYRGLLSALRAVRDDPDLDVLVLTGTGDVFVAGGDMSGEDTELAEGLTPEDCVPFDDFRATDVPVVAAVNGACVASGLVLMLLADVAVASDRAVFRAPELRRGVAETWHAALLPAHVGVGRAKQLVFTGRTVTAQEALAMGLVAEVVAPDELVAATDRVVGALLEAAPRARALWKRAVDAHYGPVDTWAFATTVAGPEATEGFAAFLERRRPAWAAAAAPEAND
ncbi:MAG: enoyl-CoA hydratase/isomerase family protein [Actinobacteria bacterium]|nr:enoyl-CoA hydratase/isomerase family protein [Actinomycetota bacterium]